jgi:hypothetical protein
MLRYGKDKCKHFFVIRNNGYEEYCTPVVCRKCGAFGCSHDIEEYKQDLRIKLNGDSNINKRWKNPYV